MRTLGAERLSNLPEPTETLCSKAGPGTQVCMTLGTGTCATRPQSNSHSQESGSQDPKRTGHEELHPGTGMKFKGGLETRKKECSRATGLTGHCTVRPAVMAVSHSGNRSEFKF